MIIGARAADGIAVGSKGHFWDYFFMINVANSQITPPTTHHPGKSEENKKVSYFYFGDPVFLCLTHPCPQKHQY